MTDPTPLKPEVVASDPFRDYALAARQYWAQTYDEWKTLHPLMTLAEYLDLQWIKLTHD